MRSPSYCLKRISPSQSTGSDIDITGVGRVPYENIISNPTEQAQFTAHSNSRSRATKHTAFEPDTEDAESDDDGRKSIAYSVISDGWEVVKMDTFTFATSTQIPLPIRVKLYEQEVSRV